jgi:hypothetical protein
MRIRIKKKLHVRILIHNCLIPLSYLSSCSCRGGAIRGFGGADARSSCRTFLARIVPSMSPESALSAPRSGWAESQHRTTKPHRTHGRVGRAIAAKVLLVPWERVLPLLGSPERKTAIMSIELRITRNAAVHG